MEVTHTDIFKAGPYSLHVGRVTEDGPLRYLVIHDTYRVLEYDTDILAAAMAWAQHFATELKKIESGQFSETEESGQNILPFSGRPN